MPVPIRLDSLGNNLFYDCNDPIWSSADFKQIEAYLKRPGNERSQEILHVIYKEKDTTLEDIKLRMDWKFKTGAVSKFKITAVCNSLSNLKVIEQDDYDKERLRYTRFKVGEKGEQYRSRFYNNVFKV